MSNTEHNSRVQYSTIRVHVTAVAVSPAVAHKRVRVYFSEASERRVSSLGVSERLPWATNVALVENTALANCVCVCMCGEGGRILNKLANPASHTTLEIYNVIAIYVSP